MDLSEIMNIQDRLLENNAYLLFNYEMPTYITVSTIQKKKSNNRTVARPPSVQEQSASSRL